VSPVLALSLVPGHFNLFIRVLRMLYLRTSVEVEL